MNINEKFKLDIAHKLAEILERPDINQVKMSKVTNRSQSYISKLLIAESIPSKYFLIKLADFLYGENSDKGIELFIAAGYVSSDMCYKCVMAYLHFIRKTIPLDKENGV